MIISPENTNVVPVSPSERILSLDVLRGFAVLGILIMNIQSYSMLRAEIDGFIEVDMSSQINEIVLYYPKFDPEDEDQVFAKVAGIPSKEKIGAELTLYVDPENLSNPSNYVYAKAYREFSENLQLIQFILPFFE